MSFVEHGKLGFQVQPVLRPLQRRRYTQGKYASNEQQSDTGSATHVFIRNGGGAAPSLAFDAALPPARLDITRPLWRRRGPPCCRADRHASTRVAFPSPIVRCLCASLGQRVVRSSAGGLVQRIRVCCKCAVALGGNTGCGCLVLCALAQKP